MSPDAMTIDASAPAERTMDEGSNSWTARIRSDLEEFERSGFFQEYERLAHVRENLRTLATTLSKEEPSATGASEFVSVAARLEELFRRVLGPSIAEMEREADSLWDDPTNYLWAHRATSGSGGCIWNVGTDAAYGRQRPAIHAAIKDFAPRWYEERLQVFVNEIADHVAELRRSGLPKSPPLQQKLRQLSRLFLIVADGADEWLAAVEPLGKWDRLRWTLSLYGRIVLLEAGYDPDEYSLLSFFQGPPDVDLSDLQWASWRLRRKARRAISTTDAVHFDVTKQLAESVDRHRNHERYENLPGRDERHRKEWLRPLSPSGHFRDRLDTERLTGMDDLPDSLLTELTRLGQAAPYLNHLEWVSARFWWVPAAEQPFIPEKDQRKYRRKDAKRKAKGRPPKMVAGLDTGFMRKIRRKARKTRDKFEKAMRRIDELAARRRRQWREELCRAWAVSDHDPARRSTENEAAG